MTISQRVQDVRARRLQAVIGMPVHANYLNDCTTLTNKDPQAVQITEITVDTATNGHLYTITINGVEVSYQADGATSEIEIANGLEDAINEEPTIYGQVSAESDGVDTVTLTGQYPGEAFTIDDLDALCSASTTQPAAEAASVEFGRLMISGGYQEDEANELGIKAKAAAFTAQVDSYVLVYDASVNIIVDIDVEGEHYHIEHTMASDLDTSGAALVTAVNAVMPANTVLAAYSSGSDTFSLTAEKAGMPIKTSITFGAGRDTGAATKTSNYGVDTDLNLKAIGFSVYTTDEEIVEIAGEEAVYPANAGVLALRKGEIWLECDDTVAAGDALYIELGNADTNGRAYPDNSSTRVRLDRGSWQRSSRSSNADGIAVASLAPPPARA